MAVERILGEETGISAKKLHTGRSRNDQVATDFRMFVKNSLKRTQKIVAEFLQAVFFRAENDKNIIMAGYTHYQQAQPVSMAHYWLSLFFLMKREYEKIENTIKNCDVMPLGSGAIAGCGFSIDRQNYPTRWVFLRRRIIPSTVSQAAISYSILCTIWRE